MTTLAYYRAFKLSANSFPGVCFTVRSGQCFEKVVQKSNLKCLFGSKRKKKAFSKGRYTSTRPQEKMAT